MKKTRIDTIVYRILVPSFLWRGKRHGGGELLKVIPHSSEPTRKQEQRKLDTHVAQGAIRVATPEDLAQPGAGARAVATPEPAHMEAAADPEIDNGAFAFVETRAVAPSPVNPRRYFDAAAMRELTDSVREKGVRVALNVRAMPEGQWFVEPGRQGGADGWFALDRRRFRDAKSTTGQTQRTYEHIPREVFQDFFPSEGAARAAVPKWEIIAGERRWRAAKCAGREKVRVIIETMDDLEAAELQVIENDQRADLTPLESAAGYDYLLRQPGYDIKKLIAKTGKSKTIIYERLKLLELPKIAQDAVTAGRLPMSTAQLIGSADEDVKEEAALIILGYKTRWNEKVSMKVAQDAPVESYREAERTVAYLKEQKTKAASLAAATAQLKARGLQVLEGKVAEKVLSYGGHVSPSGGHVAAKDICPRDPQGRTWEKVLKETAVQPRAVVQQEYNGKASGVIVFEREQANDALKKLGLWDAEGSKVAKEKLEQQKRKAKEAREDALMHADFDRIVDGAKSGEMAQIRAVLLAAVAAGTRHDSAEVRFLCERRKLAAADKSQTGHCNALRKHASEQTMGGLTALVAELAAIAIGSGWNHYSEGRKTLRKLLDLSPDEEAESPEVRTAEEEDVEEAEPALL